MGFVGYNGVLKLGKDNYSIESVRCALLVSYMQRVWALRIKDYCDDTVPACSVSVFALCLNA